MVRLLTKRKQKWVQSRQPDVVRGDVLTPNMMTATRYYRNLDRLIQRMTDETESELRKFFSAPTAKEFFTTDASTASGARIITNALIQKYDRYFAKNAKKFAEQMAEAADKNSSAAMHSSIQQLSGGLSLPTSALTAQAKQVLNATITENVALIKSIPAKYLNGVQQATMRSITTGQGLKDLVPYLKKHKDITERRARMIALDQNRKAFNNLNKARMERLGLKKFEWLHTSGSTEPRPLHERMSGNIYSLDDLPVIDEKTGERGIPGQLINCRCRMLPVIEIGEE